MAKKSAGKTKTASGKPSAGRGGGGFLRPFLIFTAVFATASLAVWLLMFRENPAGGDIVETTSRTVSGTIERLKKTTGSKTDETEKPKVPASLPGKSEMASRMLEQSAALFTEQKFTEARDRARIALKSLDYSDPRWARAAEYINDSSIALFNGRGTSDDIIVCKVGQVDSFSAIAERYGTTAAAIKKLNKIPLSETAPLIGRELRIYKGDWKIRITNANKKLFLMDGDDVVLAFPVGVAGEYDAGAGVYRVSSKVKQPSWRYKGSVFQPGNPLNILGSRSIGFSSGAPGGGTWFIHGTNKAENIGRTIVGPGFISMRNEAINLLFNIIPVGTAVEAQR